MRPNRAARQKAAEKLTPDKRIRQGRYHFRPSMLEKRAAVEAAVIQAAIDQNPEIQQHRKFLAIPPKVRKQRLKDALLAKEEPPIKARIAKVQAQITPLVEELIKLNKQMRLLLDKQAELHARAATLTPPTEYEIKAKIKAIEVRLTNGIMRQKLEHDYTEIRRLHGLFTPSEIRRREQWAKTVQRAKEEGRI